MILHVYIIANQIRWCLRLMFRAAEAFFGAIIAAKGSDCSMGSQVVLGFDLGIVLEVDLGLMTVPLVQIL